MEGAGIWVLGPDSEIRGKGSWTSRKTNHKTIRLLRLPCGPGRGFYSRCSQILSDWELTSSGWLRPKIWHHGVWTVGRLVVKGCCKVVGRCRRPRRLEN